MRDCNVGSIKMRQRVVSKLARATLLLLVCPLALLSVSSPAASPQASDAGAPPAPRLRAVDGTADYYRRFSDSLPTHPSFFPVGVWFESVVGQTDVDLDKQAGLNTYVELTENSNLGLVRSAGMHAITSMASANTAGYLLPDEVDMWAGPGSAPWTGNWPGKGPICVPQEAACGFTIQKQLTDSLPAERLTLANYGKGVTFWESEKDASNFVNAFPDVVSDDNYWFTDPNICNVSEGGRFLGHDRALTQGECRLASNYGRTLSYVRSLVSPLRSKPVWAFVELGHPSSEDWAPTISPREIRAAVWSSIIHGARGIIYFNHNFGGTCISQHVLRDVCGSRIRPMVTKVNRQIRRLAPALNAPFVDGLVSSRGAIDISVKLHAGRFYVLAGSRSSRDQTVTMSFRCGHPTSAMVLGENRTRRIRHGLLTDRFRDADAVHIYRMSGGTTCGLR